MRRFVLLLLLAFCIIGFTSCGQTADNTGKTEGSDPAGVTPPNSGTEEKTDPIELWTGGVSYRSFGEAWYLIETEGELKTFVETPYAGLGGLGEACKDFDFTENSLVVYYAPAGSHCVEYTLVNSAIDGEELTLTFDVYRPMVQDADIMQYAFVVPVPKSSNITRCNGMEMQQL